MKIEVKIRCSGAGGSYDRNVTLDDDDVTKAAIRKLRITDASPDMDPHTLSYSTDDELSELRSERDALAEMILVAGLTGYDPNETPDLPITEQTPAQPTASILSPGDAAWGGA